MRHLQKRDDRALIVLLSSLHTVLLEYLFVSHLLFEPSQKTARHVGPAMDQLDVLFGSLRSITAANDKSDPTPPNERTNNTHAW